jgi:hypothetical protein
MPDLDDELRMLRTGEKADRDQQVADELDQDDRLAATLEKSQSQNDRPAEDSSPPTSDTD